MKAIGFNKIINKIRKIKFDKFDIVIGIAEGGIVPAVIISNTLNLKFDILWLKYRDEKNIIRYKEPRLLKKITKYKNKKILLVDDVIRSNATIRKAKKLLKGNKIKTFVINGKADYYLYNTKKCIRLPWKS